MRLALHWQVLIGLAVGVLYAWMSITFGWNDFTVDYIKPFGDIFINVLKLIAVPLVLFSIMSGVASLGDPAKLGRLGVKTVVTYLLTTMTAVIVGLLLVNLMQPGSRVSDDLLESNRIRYELWRDANGIQVLDDINLRNDPALSEKVAQITKEQVSMNDWVVDKLSKAERTKSSGPLQPLVDVVPTNIFKSLADMSMLQIIFFAVFFGVVLVGMPKDQAAPLMRAIDALNEVFVRMVWVVMKAMPIFVFSLMAGQIVNAAGSDPEMFRQLLEYLLQYSIVVVIGLAFMVFIFYPSLVAMLIKPLGLKALLAGMRDAQITAFSTSSSVATLPVTMDCVRNKIGVTV